MRAVLPTLALALLATTAFAQVPAPAPDQAGTPAPAEAAPPPVSPSPATPRAQRPANRPVRNFATVNTTHDGKLTLAQARAADWRPIVRNFAVIDKDHKGYITRRDLIEYIRARRAQRALAAPVQ
jgi:hypothetical protein